MAIASSQAEVDPASLTEGSLNGIDDFLDPGSILEAALISTAIVMDLVDEIPDEVGIEKTSPGFFGMPSDGIETFGNLELFEFYIVGSSHLYRLGNAELFYETTNDGTLAPVDAGLDPRVIPDGYEARLYRADGSVG